MKNPSAGTLVWAYSAQGLNVAGGLVLMPAALYYLSAQEVAIWYLFLAAVTLGNILDFGLSPTVSRFTAYAMAGADSFQSYGYLTEKGRSSPNYSLLKKLYHDTQRLYWLLGIFALLFLGGGGSLYLSHVGSRNDIESMSEIYLAWTGYAIAISLHLGFLYFTPFLQGSGRLEQSYKAIAASRGMIVVLGVLALVMGYGLIGLAVSQLAGMIVGILLAYHGTKTSKTWLVVRYFSRPDGRGSTYQNIFPNSWRSGVLGLSAFMINKSTVLLAGAFLPLALSAQYALMMQVLWVFMAVSLVYFNSHIPVLSRARITGDLKMLKNSYIKLQSKSLIVYSVLVISFLGGGIELLAYLNDEAADFRRVIFFVAAIMIGLELHHGMAAGYIMTKNEVPMVPSAVLSGMATVGGTVAGLMLFPDMALWVLVAVQMIVQAAYNNWKWPLEVYKEFYRK